MAHLRHPRAARRHPRADRRHPSVPAVLSGVVVAATWLALVVGTLPAHAQRAVEDYAPYQPQTRCSPSAKPGTVMLGRWIVRHHGGRSGAISRRCGGSVSEHKEGRAFDWSVDARRLSDRLRVRRLLRALFATDAAGNPDALARRMGVMYVIWDDRIWSSYDGFEARPYRSSSCRTLSRCSPTLRHRDHVHISITRNASRGLYSWYAARS